MGPAMKQALISFLALCLLSSLPASSSTNSNELPFLSVSSRAEAVGHYDDDTSHAIHIPESFPFDGTEHSTVFISTNGIISFDVPFFSADTARFPSSLNAVRNLFLVAPFWDDVDLRDDGDIFYEAHSTASGNLDSLNLMSQVDGYIQGETGEDFSGTWMLVAHWDGVHPWPHGETGDPGLVAFLKFRFPDHIFENTFQAILVTNGTSSYAIFTYQCGLLGWSRDTTIGFNAPGGIFMNHPLSGTSALTIQCSNSPASNWTNVLYDLTGDRVNITEAPTVEPSQATYLSSLSFLNISGSTSVLDPCQNCTSPPINLSSPGVPFGNYYHGSVYVSVNGIISFDRPFSLNTAENFPSQDGDVHFSYLVAPFWSDVDTRRAGTVRYESYYRGDSSASDQRLAIVEQFLLNEEGVEMQGEWMLLAAWENVHPFPHGDIDPADVRVNPYLQSTNSFQAVLISNNTKTYAIFIYNCDEVGWSGEATIGFNAAADFFENHPLSGLLRASSVDCVHSSQEGGSSSVNNVVFDLTPGMLSDSTPPPSPTSLGSCVAANHTGCCDSGNCLGDPGDCMCDEFCHLLGDCCYDIEMTCNREPPPDNETYLIFANRHYINRVNINAENFHIVNYLPDQIVLAIDYDYRRGYIYWSDAVSDQLFRSNLDGSNITSLANATHEDVEDIALDWVSNNLYWTESVTGNIEVLDLDTMERAVILNVGANSVVRGVAVDPSTREIFWTDWGSPAKVEKASMDGSNRQVLHSLAVVWPNGITCDYETRRIYWVDAWLNALWYSNYDGSGRQLLLRGLEHPFAVTIEGNLVFWTDWFYNSVDVGHKIFNAGIFVVREGLRVRPYGIEAITPTRQANTSNPCLGSSCSHLCLLNSNASSSGFTCVCPRGFELLPGGSECRDLNTTRIPPVLGSCAMAGYSTCCSSILVSSFCAGSEPHNCFCDRECRDRDDCCPDIDMTCPNNGSCGNVGLETCCNLDYSNCRGDDGVCMCDSLCTGFGDCCSDFAEICPPGLDGSCANANFTQCCTSGECFGGPVRNCKCDADCRPRGDCCQDIDSTCSLVPLTTPTPTTTTTTTARPTTPTSPPTTSTPVIIPGPVPDLQVSVINQRELEVSWRALAGVNNYVITVTNYSGDVAATRTVQQSRDPGYVVRIDSGIGPFIPYNVTVIASTAQVGQGPPSSLDQYIFTAEAVPPVAPQVNEPTRESATIIKVTWAKLTPDIALGLITNYTVSYQKSSGKSKRQADSVESGFVVVGADASQARIEKLNGSAAYTIVMWANTSAGMGTMSEPFTVPVLSTPEPQGGVNGAAIGGVIGALLVLVLAVVVALAVLWFLKKYNKSKNTDYSLFGNESDYRSKGVDGDKAKILDHGEEDQSTADSAEKNMTAYDNPIYEVTLGEGLPPGDSSTGLGSQQADPDFVKEDLSMIGKPVMTVEEIDI